MLPYQYHALQHHDSIRILVLHPSSELFDPITCTIQHERLSDESLEYEALSYTWGDANPQFEIQFRDLDRNITVGKNCHNSLRRLRLQNANRLLWIDAVCINQEDLSERASQVRIMDSVFSQASSVLVFLGEEIRGCVALFEELAVADRLLRLDEDFRREPPSNTIIQELEALFEKPWFTRVWVLQEVCGKKTVQFMYGSASASFDAITQVYFGYHNKSRTKQHWPRVLEWLYRPPEEFATPQHNLWHRLNSSRDCQATDPRDKVFALKSLIGSGQESMDHLIDYTKSPEECFIRVAHYLLRVLGLRLLTAVRHPHNMDMPSWTPDWSSTLPLTWVHFEPTQANDIPSMYQTLRHLDLPNQDRYTTQSYGPGQASLELVVTGCQYARIVERSHTFHFTDVADAERQMGNLYAMLEIHEQDNIADVAGSDVGFLAHLWPNLMNTMSSTDAKMLHEWLIGHLGRVYCDEDTFVTPTNASCFLKALEQCSIALLDNNEMVIVPGAAQPGDVICILLGTFSPCALRLEPGGHWSLVCGDCHIFVSNFQTFEYREDTDCIDCDEYIMHNQGEVQGFRIR